MTYADVSVIVDGALDESETFFDCLVMGEYLESIQSEAKSHGYPTSVFVLYHEHEETDEGCDCIQYLQDHHPWWTNESEGQ